MKNRYIVLCSIIYLELLKTFAVGESNNLCDAVNHSIPIESLDDKLLSDIETMTRHGCSVNLVTHSNGQSESVCSVHCRFDSSEFFHENITKRWGYNKMELEAVDKLLPNTMDVPYDLHLQDYQETELPSNFLAAKTLDHLKLKNFSITDIKDDSIQANDVKQIGLFHLHNMTSVESRAFARWNSLEVIHIFTADKLTKADLDLTSNPNVKEFKVGETLLERMAMPKLHPDVSATDVEIQLRDSPLICNCHLAWTKNNTWKSSKVSCKEPPISPTRQITVEEFISCQAGPGMTTATTTTTAISSTSRPTTERPPTTATNEPTTFSSTTTTRSTTKFTTSRSTTKKRSTTTPGSKGTKGRAARVRAPTNVVTCTLWLTTFVAMHFLIFF